MLDNPENVLEIDNIWKNYGEDTVLRGISLKVARGETLAVIGASGSGKSTLLRCACLLEPFDDGEVRLNGEHIAGGGKPRRERRQQSRMRSNFGVVFQQFNLFHGRTALQNVMEGPIVVRGLPKEQCRSRAEELLDRVGLKHRKNARAWELSGGEQQRVAIARSLAMDPACLMLDEPTSALDPELVIDVLEVIAELAAGGMTMMIVTHEMAFAYEAAHRVLFILKGTVGEGGDAKTVLKNPETPELQSFLRRFNYTGVL